MEMRSRLTNHANRRRNGAWIVAAIALFTGLFALAAPDPDHLPSLWVTHSRDTVKLDAATGQPLLALDDGGKVRTLLIDPVRARLWTYRNHRLNAYGFDGTPLVTTVIPRERGHRRNRDDEDERERERPDDDREDDRDDDGRGDDDRDEEGKGEQSLLTLHPADGTLWLAVDRRLHRIDADGTLLDTVETRQPIRGIAADPESGWVWIAQRRHLAAYDRDGERRAEVELNRRDTVRSLTWAPAHHQLWVVLQRTIRRIDTSGTVHAEHRVRNAAHPVADGDGGLWFATGRKLRHIDEAGVETLDIRPFGRRDRIVALAFDAADGGVWAATKRALRRVSADGEPGETITAAEGRRTPRVLALAAYSDILPPLLEITAPDEGALLNDNRPLIELEAVDDGIGIDRDTLELHADDSPLTLHCEGEGPTLNCRPAEPLAEGDTRLTATVEDYAGNRSEPAERRLTIDTLPPEITVDTPADGLVTNQPQHSLTGALSETAELTLNGAPLALADDHRFTTLLTLDEGSNPFALDATDPAGNHAQRTLRLHLDTQPPSSPQAGALTFAADDDGRFTLTAPAGSVEPEAAITVTNGDTQASVQADAEGAFTVAIDARAGDTLSLTVADAAGNLSAALEIPLGPPLPPDPAGVAPPLDGGDFAGGIDFLFAGERPIQSGVAPGTIEARRAAVLRGRVLLSDGSPLSGVTVAVKDHPELGETISRADGWFDLAVNGGGLLTLDYRRDGFLPLQRRLETPWRDYALAPEVVMLPLDPIATVVDLGASTEVQVARGSVVSDADGERRATLLVPPGTQATLTLPDGSRQPLESLTVRATEYTVGAGGPGAMPGPLPPTSGYTYAVELSADEALAAGAERIDFDRPLPYYVENFLGFPVGGPVPAGWYDYRRAAWIPADDGRVIEVVSINDGIAEIDSDGDGVADDDTQLAELGVDRAERARLAELYAPGKSLWRIPLTHFTPWDFNWPFTLPEDAIAPADDPQVNPRTEESPRPDDRDGDECDGCVIQAQSQTLGEQLPLTGSEFSLHYRSDRAPGYLASRTLEIPLTGGAVPESLIGVELIVEAAGERFVEHYPPQPNLRHTFHWSGIDAYGRRVPGTVEAKITITYAYREIYTAPRTSGAGSFAAPGTEPLIPPPSAATQPATSRIGYRRSTWNRTLGGYDAQREGLGGWNLSHHHAYDPLTGTLYRGDGSRRQVDSQGNILETLVHSNSYRPRDGGDLAQLPTVSLETVAVNADGSYYLGDNAFSVIYKVNPDGTFEWFAGNGGTYNWSLEDDVPLREASFGRTRDLDVGPDGELYLTDSRFVQIRRIGKDGLIDVIAGGGGYWWDPAFAEDGSIARGGKLRSLSASAVTSNGTVYFIDYLAQRVALVTPDGILRHVAGNGRRGYSGDGGPALDASFAFSTRSGIETDADGNVYVADEGNHRVRVIRPNGIIETVAGDGQSGYRGDGGPAREASLNFPRHLTVDRNGALWIGDEGNYVIRHVTPDGTITTLAGTGQFGIDGDGGPARRAQLSEHFGFAHLPDGELIVTDLSNNRIRKLSSNRPQRNLDGPTAVASEDGTEQYLFDATGRHLATLDTLTGATLHAFGYDAEQRLSEIIDVDGERTTIERDAAGAPVAIVTPDGHRTALGVDADGYLRSAADPTGAAYALGYHADGLLSSFSTPRGSTSHYRYDTAGRLAEDVDPVGGGWRLAREETSDGYLAQLTSGEGRVYQFAVETLPDGGRIQTNTDPAGLQTLREFAADDTERTLTPDGTLERIVHTPDPRFGMAAPLEGEHSLTLPSGLTRTTLHTREATLALPGDPLSATTLSDAWTINGRRFESVYDTAARTRTETSAGGRITTTRLDARGRLLSEQLTGLAPVEYGYDARGRLTSSVEASDTQRREHRLAYNADGWLAAVTDPLGRQTTFTYDAAGRITGQSYPDGRTVGYHFDTAGNLTELVTPNGDRHRFAYTPRDLEERYAPPELAPTADPATHYRYSLDKEITEVIRPDGRRLTLDYDAGGRLTAATQHDVTAPIGTTRYDYAPTDGSLTAITAPDGNTLRYTYDGPLPLTEQWLGEVNGTAARAYDDNFRIVERRINGTDPIAFLYDDDGLLTGAGALALGRDAETGLTTATTQGAVTSQRSYNPFGELASERFEVAGAAVMETTYGRDLLGRIFEKSETLDGLAQTERYSYDPAGRLIEVDRDGERTRYHYDANGNRLSRDGPDGLEGGEYDVQDRLVAYNGADYGYTANGERLTRTDAAGTTAYDYDLHGNLLAVALPDGRRIDYLIDGRNRRIGKKVDGVLEQGLLYRDQLNPIAELDGAGNVVSRFVYGDKENVPAYLIRDGVTYRILSDHLGSPRLVIDTETGAVVQRMAYDEFGRVIEDSNPGFQPFGFAGGLYDQDTGLVRFGARDYDPETGRWTSKDPIGFDGGDSNLYGYVLSDPVNAIDPTGEILQFCIAWGGRLWSAWRASKTLKKISSIDDLVRSSSPGRSTRGRSTLYDRTGGLKQANKEFDSLAPKDVRNIPGGRVGKLSNGRTAIVRERSTDGRATLEIQQGKNRLKFRYDD